jgi:hypothetical protein
MILTEETDERGDRLFSVSLCPPQIPQREVCDRARSFVVLGRRTFASATVRLVNVQYRNSERPLRVMVMDIPNRRKLLAVSPLIHVPCDFISFHKVTRTLCNAVGGLCFRSLSKYSPKRLPRRTTSFNGTWEYQSWNVSVCVSFSPKMFCSSSINRIK